MFLNIIVFGAHVGGVVYVETSKTFHVVILSPLAGGSDHLAEIMVSIPEVGFKGVPCFFVADLCLQILISLLKKLGF